MSRLFFGYNFPATRQHVRPMLHWCRCYLQHNHILTLMYFQRPSIHSMAHVTRRLFSTTSSRRSSAAEACSELLTRFGDELVSTRTQLFDANQLQLLSLTLGRPFIHHNLAVEKGAPPDGTPIPPGYHLAYFTVPILESRLGLDGSDRIVNPLEPFTRRMWAGGELEWNQNPKNFLRVGQIVQETTKLLSAEPKLSRLSGDEIVVVGVEKTYETDKGIALIDRRNWVFQKEIAKAQPPTNPTEKPLPKGAFTRDFTQSEVTLFRFSALTFNGHKIHYSKEWAREVEGHRDCVVHGPLNLINILDFWRDTVHSAAENFVPESIVYRARSPLYVGEQYRCILKDGGNTDKFPELNFEIWDSFGNKAMTATLVN
jgi:hydroxyacyl-ACP dehydratase HTD2-like protein with hotdog domain